MNCKLCSSEAKCAKSLTVRGGIKADYYTCPECGLLFVNNPTWLKEAYLSPINITDTGYVMRNVYLSKRVLMIFSLFFGKDKTYLDYGGGYGMLTRLMRDYGLNFLWDDIFTENLFAKGFEYKKDSDTKIEALTTFECFEHLPSPKEEIDKMFEISDNILFSTVLLEKDIPDDKWEYYGLNHGQHVAFYSVKTLKYIAQKKGVYLNTNGKNIHMFSKRKTPNIIFKLILTSTKFGSDFFYRKLFLKSKTSSDNAFLKSKGLA